MAEIKIYLWQGLLVSFLCVACSCRNQKATNLPAQANSAASETMNKNKAIPTASMPGPGSSSGPVAPGSSRLVAEVMAIKPQLEPDKKVPCGQVPCTAIVKIRKIIAYGAAFKPTLTQGQEISVYFAFTLSPSAAYFPGLTTPLPGLKVGSVFQADIRNNPEASNGKQGYYQIYTYAVKS